MIDFTLNTALAASVALLGLFAVTDAKANEIENLALYGVDRAHCKIDIPQALIDRNIVEASMKYNATASAVLEKAGEIGDTMVAILRENGDRGQYCAKRMGR